MKIFETALLAATLGLVCGKPASTTTALNGRDGRAENPNFPVLMDLTQQKLGVLDDFKTKLDAFEDLTNYSDPLEAFNKISDAIEDFKTLIWRIESLEVLTEGALNADVSQHSVLPHRRMFFNQEPLTT